MSKIVVSTSLIAAVARWAIGDDMRPHLRCVLFKGNEMVACDGHRLVCVPVACNGIVIAVDRDLVAAAAAAQEFCKTSAPRDVEQRGRCVEISTDGEQAVINVGRFALRGPLGDPSKYPPYEQVIPKDRPEHSPDGYGFDPRYLAAIAEVQDAAGAAVGTQGVRVTGWSADRVGAMLFEGHMGIRYVVMPVRT